MHSRLVSFEVNVGPEGIGEAFFVALPLFTQKVFCTEMVVQLRIVTAMMNDRRVEKYSKAGFKYRGWNQIQFFVLFSSNKYKYSPD